MRRRSPWLAFAALACAVVASVGAFVAWRALADHEDVAPTSATSSPATASDASTALDRDRASETRSADAPASIRVATPDGAARLHGVVRSRENNVPVEGLVVTARYSGPEGRNVAQATTDVLGRYALEWPFAVTLRSIEVAASAATAPSELLRERRVAPSAPYELDLWVTRGAVLEGRVVDEQGSAIAGAEVFVDSGGVFAPAGPHARATTSARDGSFRVEHVGRRFHAHARAPGRACLVGLRGELAPNAEAKGLEIVLAPAATLRGIVVDSLDRPLEGVEVSIDGTTSRSSSDATSVPGVRSFTAVRASATTLADGRFELASVPERAWNVGARHRDRLACWQRVDPGTDARIVLDAGLVLAGVVRAHDGSFAAGARVRVEGGDATVRVVTTDANGRFEARGLAETERGVVAVLAAGNALWAKSPVPIHANAPASIDVRLEPPMPLAGRVVDPHGRPIADALVRIEGDRLVERDPFQPERLEALLDEAERTTDRDGRFRFASLHDAVFELRVSAPSEPDLVATKTTLSGHEDLVIEVDRSKLQRVVFRGRVRDALTKEPVTELMLAPMRFDGIERRSARTVSVFDERGEFRIAGFEAGTYSLSVSAAGYAAWSSEDRELGHGVADFDVVLFPKRSLTVEVRWAGAPPADRGVRVRFADAEGKPIAIESGTRASSREAWMREPTQTFAGLPAARIVVKIEHGRAGSLSREVDLTLPATEPFVFELVAPEHRMTRGAVLLFATSDPATLELGLEELLAAVSARRVDFVASPVDVVFVDATGGEVGRVALSAFEGGTHRFEGRRPGGGFSGTTDGPPFATFETATIPVEVRASGAGFVERVVPFVASDPPQPMPLVLLRTP